MENLERKSDTTKVPTIMDKCECGEVNEIVLDKSGIKYQKCGGCHIFYEIDTRIELKC